MKKVLEDLYFGEIQPNISNHDENSRLKKAEQIVDENEELLLKLLEGKEKKFLLNLVDAQSEVDGNLAYENFAYGFKLGARIILESVAEL